MDQKPKPTKDLLIEVQNIKTRLDSINLYREFEIINTLNNKKVQIMDSFDWSDQEYELNGKSGLTDCFGEVLIPAEYDETWFRANYFVTREKPIACRKGDKWGMVLPDGNGTIVTDFLYDNIFLGEYYSFWNLIIVVNNDKFGFIDFKGNSLTPLEIDEIYLPCNDMGQFRKGDKYGFICGNGDYIEPLYEEIGFSESNNFYRVKLNGQWGFLDQDKNFEPTDHFSEDLGCVYYGRTLYNDPEKSNR